MMEWLSILVGLASAVGYLTWRDRRDRRRFDEAWRAFFVSTDWDDPREGGYQSEGKP